jgi:drug/metabolite transporter, DME family
MTVDPHDAERDPPPRWPLRASTRGMVYCVLSAVFYTLMGICQRELSTTADPVWVNCVQASVSTAVFGFYLSLCSLRGRSVWPTRGVAVGLMVLGVVTQLGGSSYQWSLGVVGLAIGNPLQMGVMLAAAALLGWIVLGERVGWRAILAIALITGSVLLLSVGADEASETINAAKSAETDGAVASGEGVGARAADEGPDKLDVPLLMVLLGVGAACFAGVAFAILTVGMRKTATENTAPEAIVFFINVMGILFLGPWAAARLGLPGMLATSPRDLIVMLAVGLCNLLAFLLIAKALQLTGVVRVNVINNALTTALTVLAGIVIFAEPANRELIIGIVLTLLGIALISTTEAEEAGKANANSAQAVSATGMRE